MAGEEGSRAGRQQDPRELRLGWVKVSFYTHIATVEPTTPNPYNISRAVLACNINPQINTLTLSSVKETLGFRIRIIHTI